MVADCGLGTRKATSEDANQAAAGVGHRLSFVATVPAKVFHQMLSHPLTEKGTEQFKADWQSRPEFVSWLRELVSKQPA